MKIAVVTCYFDPDYVRARTIRAGLKADERVKLIVVKNRYTGLLRYPEVIWKLFKLRWQEKPDAWVLTFRGQEILPLVLLLAWRKPVVFDELIVPIAYATNENHVASLSTKAKHALARASEPLYRWWLHLCAVVLADTQAHAELSARTSNMNLRKYLVLPVGTDEAVFKPGSSTALPDKFQVFYYSTGMQPLHGVPVVLKAAELLYESSNIEFLLVGGKKPMERAVQASQARGAHITYQPWIPFADLPATMRASGLVLGGPFGGTNQAQRVVTTKTYQSLACGVTTLVGASEAASEFFTDKANSLIVPQSDAAALAKAITWAAEHPSELKKIGESGRRLYDREFSSKIIAQKLTAMVDELSGA